MPPGGPLAHWLVGGADGGRLFVRCFDAGMVIRENIAGDVLASLNTMQWNIPSKAWTGGAVMADASLNRRMTVRLAEAVAYAQIGIAWANNTVRVMARNISPSATFDLAPVTLSVQITK